MCIKFCRFASVLVLCLFISQSVSAHVKPGELVELLKASTVFVYLSAGYQHILPYGFDHILFILCLFLLSPKLKPVLWQATAFTIAHTITLGLAMYHVITPPLVIIEPLIALSIVFVALENVFSAKLRPARIGLVFLFGLIHGMGFATSLAHMGLPKDQFFKCLILFNIGVELGQITIILAAYFFLARWFADQPNYRKRIVIPLSILIALIATYWFFQRVL